MYTYKGTVTRVIDGDTIEIEIDLGFKITYKDRFRLLGVDTPEVYGVKKGSAEYIAGKAASKFTKDLLPIGSEVTVTTHKAGKYGRWLAHVSIEDEEHNNIDVSEALLKSGNAKEYHGGKR